MRINFSELLESVLDAGYRPQRVIEPGKRAPRSSGEIEFSGVTLFVGEFSMSWQIRSSETTWLSGPMIVPGRRPIGDLAIECLESGIVRLSEIRSASELMPGRVYRYSRSDDSWEIAERQVSK